MNTVQPAASGTRIVVIGATGFTGRLVARELATGSVPCVLAARDADKLSLLAAELEVTSAAISTQVVDVTDPASLRRLIRTGDAVINCAGPFSALGEPVVRQCVEARAHYMDTAGEQPWMREMHGRYDLPAREAGVAVVNGLAFEWALGDCAAALAAHHLPGPLRSVDVIYAWRDPVTSRGTRRTSLRMVGKRAWQLQHGHWRHRPTGASWRRFRLSSGRSLGAIMFGAGEVVTIPHWSEVETVRGWLAVGGRTARLAPLVAPALPVLVPLLMPLLDRLALRAPDPDEDDREASRFTIRVEAGDSGGQRVAMEVRGRDPYGVTAAIAVRGAHRALESDPPTGVLAPSQLLDAAELLETLPVVVERQADSSRPGPAAGSPGSPVRDD